MYFEDCGDIVEAIGREKFLKGKKRQYKVNLIESINKEWADLYDRLI